MFRQCKIILDECDAFNLRRLHPDYKGAISWSMLYANANSNTEKDSNANTNNECIANKSSECIANNKPECIASAIMKNLKN
jgi:hypothetical protein